MDIFYSNRKLQELEYQEKYGFGGITLYDTQFVQVIFVNFTAQLYAL